MVYAEFAGARAGEAPLTWSQCGMWLAMCRNPQSRFTIVKLLARPPSAVQDVATVVAAIGALVSRHEALRTVMRMHDGEPRQRVIRSGRIPVRVLDASHDEPESAIRQRLPSDLLATFDREIELPFRACMIVIDGQVERILLVFDHLAVDVAGATVAAEELQVLLDKGDPPPPGLQPLDLARREEAAAAAITDNAVRYWVTRLRRIPPRMFTQVGPPAEPRTRVAVMTSPALVAAGEVLAARHKATLSTVLLTATAVLVGAWTGHSTVALNVVVGNRFRPGFLRMVAHLQKAGLFVLDLSDQSSFTELLNQAQGAALLTYRYAYYDQVAMDRATSQVNAERGTDVNPFCCFNDFSNQPLEPGRINLGEADVRAMLPATALGWRPDPSQVRCHLCLRVKGSGRTGYQFELSANTDYLAPPAIERFLRSVERYLVTSAFAEVRLGELREQVATGELVAA